MFLLFLGVWLGMVERMRDGVIDAIECLIEEKTGRAFLVRDTATSHGGCIHQSGVVNDGERRFFVKRNSVDCLEQFEAEADGLAALRETNAIGVPDVIGAGSAGETAFLVIEALELSGGAPAGGWCLMGQQLAKVHQCVGEGFGWRRDNFIGSTPQMNDNCEDWAKFFISRRLRPQFDLAESQGISLGGVGEFMDRAVGLLSGHAPSPSLLHGDLWSGNASFTAEGDPVIYDPAV